MYEWTMVLFARTCFFVLVMLNLPCRLFCLFFFVYVCYILLFYRVHVDSLSILCVVFSILEICRACSLHFILKIMQFISFMWCWYIVLCILVPYRTTLSVHLLVRVINPATRYLPCSPWYIGMSCHHPPFCIGVCNCLEVEHSQVPCIPCPRYLSSLRGF